MESSITPHSEQLVSSSEGGLERGRNWRSSGGMKSSGMEGSEVVWRGGLGLICWASSQLRCRDVGRGLPTRVSPVMLGSIS